MGLGFSCRSYFFPSHRCPWGSHCYQSGLRPKTLVYLEAPRQIVDNAGSGQAFQSQRAYRICRMGGRMCGIGAWHCFVRFLNNLAPYHNTDGACSFMRPNCLHYVLTEQPSIVYGNYFFACSAIQQTVLGWVHTRMLGMLVTNVELVETRRILVCMMCVWARMIQVRYKDNRDRPHVPMVETRDGFLDVLALGNLLIFMQCLTHESERDSLELKLRVAAYTDLMIWLDCHIALENLEGTSSHFSAARIAFRRSAKHFGLALLRYQKFL